MRFGVLVSWLLMLVGLGATGVGVGLIAVAHVERPAIEAAIEQGVDALAQVERGMSRAEAGYGEAESLLPQVVGTLDQAAQITAVTGAVLGETSDAGREMVASLELLARDLNTLAGRLQLVARPRELRETSAQVKKSAAELDEAVERLGMLRAEVDRLAPHMSAIAKQVRAVEGRLAPTRTALPAMRARVAAARERVDPAALGQYAVWAADVLGAVFVLCGLALWGVGSTRRRLSALSG